MKEFQKKHKIVVPLTVPKEYHDTFLERYHAVTHGTGKLFLFAGDQKIEHLNDDFVGEGISKDSADPKHIFKIASRARIGVFATHLGLLSRYGYDYPDVNYLVKLNGKSNLVAAEQKDPLSLALHSVNDVMLLQQTSGLKIAGVGYTLYLGSEYEDEMMREAAHIITEAHRYGLLTVLWCYPRGVAIKNPYDSNLIAGATGVACALGADFVKVTVPKNNQGHHDATLLTRAVAAAGNTRVICSGGPMRSSQQFLDDVSSQLGNGALGVAVGRNIHSKSLDEAISFCDQIAEIVLDENNNP